MRFEFFEVPSIPRLAWCAKLLPSQEIVKIIHGPGLEVHEDWFYEGAWDGPFDGPGFVEATTCTGTGARIQNGTVEFVSPTEPYRGLVSLKTPKITFISNSLPFLLAQTGDKPDIDYLDYYNDLFHNFNRGHVRRPRPLVMKNGSRVYIHFCCNITFGQYKITKIPKIISDPPTDFEDYRDRLVAMLVRLRENATDPRRDKQIYQPVVTLSRGYDSVACAALGAAAGWKEAVTMVPEDSSDPDNDDDGTPVAEYLGLSIEKFNLHAWQQRIDIPEAEFVAIGWGGVMVRFVEMEEKLRGTLLVLGNAGDRTWAPDSKGVLPNWGRPRTLQTLSMGPESLWEFQLRVGFITVDPATYLGVHWNELYRIMTSDEMHAWSIGGDYDRPFPRRIAEGMGIPRELFGQRKMASSHDFPSLNPSQSGEKDYKQFLNEAGHGRFYKKQRLIPYHFHWGIDRTMRRYDISWPDDPE